MLVLSFSLSLLNKLLLCLNVCWEKLYMVSKESFEKKEREQSTCLAEKNLREGEKDKAGIHVKQKYYKRWNERDTFSAKHVIPLYFFKSCQKYACTLGYLSPHFSLSLSLWLSLCNMYSCFLSLFLSLSQKFPTNISQTSILPIHNCSHLIIKSIKK